LSPNNPTKAFAGAGNTLAGDRLIMLGTPLLFIQVAGSKPPSRVTPDGICKDVVIGYVPVAIQMMVLAPDAKLSP
jgi:hypothetical protein